jgi:sRNA-binding carbon storage regulator CsrA
LRGGQVSLGFDAPTDVRIFREEVLHSPAPEPHAERTVPVDAAPAARDGAPR